jgi:hypothetical protein
LKDRFLHDDFESGLYFDLYPLKRGTGDQDALNVRITRALAWLASIRPHGWWKWYPTLLLNEKQIYDLTEKYEAMFSGKCYLLLYKAGADNVELPYNLFFAEQGGGMICNPTGTKDQWKYYTTWNVDELATRFRRVEKREVDDYVFQEGGVTPPPPPPPDTNPGCLSVFANLFK